MSTLNAAYLNELYKLSKKKKIVIAAILDLFAVTVAALIVSLLDNFAGIRFTGESEFSVLVLSVLNYTLFPLFTAFVCIDMFSGEFAENTIKTTLTAPVSRLKIFLAKLGAAASFILSNLAFVMVASLAVSFFINGTGHSFHTVFLSYAASFFPLMVFALMVILIANLARGTTGAFMLTVLAYVVLLILGMLFPTYKSFLFTSSFDWYVLFGGGYFNYQKVLRLFCILAGWGLMMFGGGYYLFDKREI